MNLLTETIECIELTRNNIDDIIFIGSENDGYSCSWDEFKILAEKDYDNGFGYQVVASDLIIVFKNGDKLYRTEYDGSEGWNLESLFIMSKNKRKITNLFSKGGGQSLDDLNKDWNGINTTRTN